MAVIYCRSTDGNNADDGSTWALAKQTLAAALTAAGAGGTVYVSHVHAETPASAYTLASPGTNASPTNIYCVNDGAEPPTTLADTATVTLNAGAISFTGFAYCYGVYFGAGTSSTPHVNFTSTSGWWWRLEKCTLALRSAAGNVMNFGQSSGTLIGQLLELIDTDLAFSNTGQMIALNGILRWRGGALTGTKPTAVFSASPQGPCRGYFNGVDLSNITATTIVPANSVPGYYEFVNCKLNAGGALAGAPSARGALRVEAINTDSGDTSYKYRRRWHQGDIDTEIVIVRTGGATDGTTPYSHKLVSGANAAFHSPMESPELMVWNDTTGSAVTATVEVVTDNVTLTDAEAWLEVEYLGTSGFPLSLLITDRAAILGTPANQASSSETWTTTGLGTPVKQKLSVTFTAQEKGFLRARVCVAKASTTVYYDPMVVLT